MRQRGRTRLGEAGHAAHNEEAEAVGAKGALDGGDGERRRRGGHVGVVERDDVVVGVGRHQGAGAEVVASGRRGGPNL